MKKIILLGSCVLLAIACKNNSVETANLLSHNLNYNDYTETELVEVEKIKEILSEDNFDQKKEYASFGKKITPQKALSKEAMLKKYQSLKKGDTLNVKFASNIKEVCKKKGCWMSMELSNSKESFVRFKDYGFFVPLNADKSKAIVSGKAYIDVISIDELKHYAKDGGKSQSEIDNIKEPKITYAFQADGVLIEK